MNFPNCKACEIEVRVAVANLVLKWFDEKEQAAGGWGNLAREIERDPPVSAAEAPLFAAELKDWRDRLFDLMRDAAVDVFSGFGTKHTCERAPCKR